MKGGHIYTAMYESSELFLVRDMLFSLFQKTIFTEEHMRTDRERHHMMQ